MRLFENDTNKSLGKENIKLSDLFAGNYPDDYYDAAMHTVLNLRMTARRS